MDNYIKYENVFFLNSAKNSQHLHQANPRACSLNKIERLQNYTFWIIIGAFDH